MLRAASKTSAMVAAGLMGLVLAAAAPALQPSTPSSSVAERIKRDVARCKKTENLETCDDAVRWEPSDPALLVAFGDALMRTQHPADALRQYQRAAALAPRIPGVGAKISAAEARLPSKRIPARLAQLHSAVPASAANLAAKPAKPPLHSPPPGPSPGLGQSFSNEAADTHSH